jgi:MFS family permease
MLRQFEPDTNNRVNLVDINLVDINLVDINLVDINLVDINLVDSSEAASSRLSTEANSFHNPAFKNTEPRHAEQNVQPNIQPNIEQNTAINPEPNLTSGHSHSDHPSAQEQPSDTIAKATEGATAALAKPIDPEIASPLAPSSDLANTAADNGLSHERDLEEGLWPVFRNRDFLTLWSGQVFSQIADKIYLVLMIAIISSTFKSPGQTISGWVSAMMIAFTIPAVLFGSLAGVYVDRWEKKPVLVATNLLRGSLVALIPILLWATAGWQVAGLPVGFYLLLIVTFLVSTLTQFFAPAEQAVIPLIVKERNLLSANSLYTTTMMASVIVGFAVGEPLLALADGLLAPIDRGSGVGKSVLVGVSYAIAGGLLLLMSTPETKTENPEQPHVWQDIKDGFAYLKTEVLVRNAMVQLTVLFSVFAALAVLAVRLAEVIPSIRSSQFGFLLAAGGVGLAIGAVAIGQFGQRFSRPQLGLIGALGMTATLSGLSLAPAQLWPSLGLIGVLGFFGAMVGIPMQTTIQETTPEDMRGKVFGLQNNVVNIALSLPLALAGIAETFFGLRVVFGLLAGLVAVSGFLTWSLVSAALKSSEEAM